MAVIAKKDDSKIKQFQKEIESHVSVLTGEVMNIDSVRLREA